MLMKAIKGWKCQGYFSICHWIVVIYHCNQILSQFLLRLLAYFHFLPVVPCWIFISITVQSSFLSEVWYFFITFCSTTNPLPLRFFCILQDTLAYSWLPCLIAQCSALSFKSFSVSPFLLVWHGCQYRHVNLFENRKCLFFIILLCYVLFVYLFWLESSTFVPYK